MRGFKKTKYMIETDILIIGAGPTGLFTVFEELARSVVAETVKRNENLPATEAIKITTMAGCSAVKK